MVLRPSDRQLKWSIGGQRMPFQVRADATLPVWIEFLFDQMDSREMLAAADARARSPEKISAAWKWIELGGEL